MARTKTTAKASAKSSSKACKASSKKTSSKKKSSKKSSKASKAAKPETKKRRYRAGTVALREIRKYQKSTDLLMQKQPFKRVMRRLVKDNAASDLRFQGTAVLALQEAAEAYLVGLLDKANLVAIHAGRVTIQKSDIECARAVRGEAPTEKEQKAHMARLQGENA